MKQIFSGYLKPKGFLGLGGYEINDKFFYDLTSSAWYNPDEFTPQTQNDWDEIDLRIIQDSWEKRDTTDYKPTQ